MSEDKKRSGINSWYGPVVLAGVLFFLGYNGLGLWDRATPDSVEVSGTMKVRRSVAPDGARMDVTVKNLLRGSARQAAEGIGAKVEGFVSFLRSDPSVSFSVLPMSIDQEVLEVGEKVTRSYEARQKVEITFRDLTRIPAVIEKAVEAEVGDVSEVTFILTSAGGIRQKIREEALEGAKKDAARKAEVLGRALGDLIDFSENDSDYGYREDEITPEEEFDHGDGQDLNEPANGQKPILVYHSVSVRYRIK
jgi:uncharacterized protein YggE